MKRILILLTLSMTVSAFAAQAQNLLVGRPAYRILHRCHGHFSRITGCVAMRILKSLRRTTNRTLADVPSLNRPARAGRLPRARPTLGISTADTLSFNRWAELWHGISFYSSNPNSALEEISPSSPTPRPWRPLPTTVRLESVSNCPETLNCARRSIKWIGWGVTAGH